MKKIIEFLSALKDNNDRDWFRSNRSIYESCRDEYLGIIGEVIRRNASFDFRLSDLKAKDTLFRINRDVRFSSDKSPYKVHFGAYLARGGRKSPEAGYYMHVGPDEVFIAGGVYSPDKEHLKVIRQEILYRPDTYRTLVQALQNKGFEQMTRDRLKQAPKDFPRDSPHIDLVRDKHYIFSRNLTEEEIRSEEIAGIMSGYFQELYPLIEFLNTAMEFTGNE